MSATPLLVALGEYDTGWHDPDRSVTAAAGVVRRAAASGARLVVLPEMATTGFTMDVEQATTLDGREVGRIARAAADSGVWVLAGVALREGPTHAVNAAVLLDPGGQVAAVYRKRRLFGYSGEDRFYVPGDAAACVTVEGVRLGLFICYELRFPELFRAAAEEIDAAVLIANWPAARRSHWDVLTRARAIENQCYVIAVNRVGEGGGLVYDGGSVAYDPWGDPTSTAGEAAGMPLVRVDPAEVARVRERYPFLRDLRPHEASRPA